jgi:hypothetical protein
MQAVRERDRHAAAGLPTSGGAVAEALGWGEAKACYMLRIGDGLLPRVEALGGDVVLTRLADRDCWPWWRINLRRGRSGGGRGGQAGRRSGARP